MRLTYSRKTALIERLADPDQWQVHFPIDWLTDPTRAWRQIDEGNIMARFNKAGDAAKFVHINGSSIQIERRPDSSTVITDESGNIVVARGTTINTEQSPEAAIAFLQSSSQTGFEHPYIDSMEVERLGIDVGFDIRSETKSVILDNHSGAKITFPKATSPVDRQTPHRTRFFHTTLFDEPGFEAQIQHVVLVTAFDLGLEPNLPASNNLDTASIHAQISETFRAKKEREAEASEYAASLGLNWHASDTYGQPEHTGPLYREAPWHDTTEFSGFALRTPSAFLVEKTDDGFAISTSLSHRELIFTQGLLLGHVRHNDRAIYGGSYNPERDQPGNILSIIEKGTTVQNHRGDEWLCTVIRSRNAPQTAHHIRQSMRRNFGLSAQDCAIINHDRGLTMVAARPEALEKAARGERATTRLIKAIETGKTGEEDPAIFVQRCFEEGADLHHVAPDAARKGKSFMGMMIENERFELITAMRDRYYCAAPTTDGP